jgi:hypothetical protein
MLIASGPPTKPPNLHRALGQIDSLTFGRIVILLFGSLLLAYLLHPFQFSLVRLLEGYWDDLSFGRLLSKFGIALHRRRLARLRAIACRSVETDRERWLQNRALERLAAYPAEDRLLPTRLGNTLRAAEDEAGQRYGLATVTMWPRLYPYLTERFAQVVDDARNQLDLTVRLCVVLMAATVISAMLLVEHGWWLAVPALTGLLAWVAYRAAVRAAASYGETVQHAFDLHRFDMLRGLHYSLPANPVEEWAFNQRLSQFFAEGSDPAGELMGDAYEHPQPKEE